MVHALLVFSALLVASASAIAAETGEKVAEDFSIAISVIIDTPELDPVTAASSVAFIDEFAVAAPLGESNRKSASLRDGTVFDLAKKAWYHREHKVWFDIEACRKWNENLSRKLYQGLSRTTTDKRAFVEAMLDPKFSVERRDDGTLEVRNDKIQYTITPAKNVPLATLDRVLAYDFLSAYQKSMTEIGAPPPTPQLTLDLILMGHEAFPSRIDATVWSPTGDVKIVATMELKALQTQDAEDARVAIKTAQVK